MALWPCSETEGLQGQLFESTVGFMLGISPVLSLYRL